jgi:cell division protein ZapA
LKRTVPVTILGQQYVVRSEASPEDVQRVAAFVNERIDEVAASARVADSLQTVVLALLNIAGAYLEIRGEESGGEIKGRLEALIDRLEKACSDVAEA